MVNVIAAIRYNLNSHSYGDLVGCIIFDLLYQNAVLMAALFVSLQGASLWLDFISTYVFYYLVDNVSNAVNYTDLEHVSVSNTVIVGD